MLLSNGFISIEKFHIQGYITNNCITDQISFEFRSDSTEVNIIDRDNIILQKKINQGITCLLFSV
jgi:hypothetical protein